MSDSSPDVTREHIIRIMLDLANPSTLQRIIRVGDDSEDIDLLLRRRGFLGPLP